MGLHAVLFLSVLTFQLLGLVVVLCFGGFHLVEGALHLGLSLLTQSDLFVDLTLSIVTLLSHGREIGFQTFDLCLQLGLACVTCGKGSLVILDQLVDSDLVLLLESVDLFLVVLSHGFHHFLVHHLELVDFFLNLLLLLFLFFLELITDSELSVQPVLLVLPDLDVNNNGLHLVRELITRG